ncbi:hypothetical protein [Paremcibacter congregatus]|uniref:hypothetical protein n=1 Tax=Paremcibacter congregatus TaxID=2043170 RepID=UPI0030EBD4EC|tara:strand:+ start:20148 stop:20339 length:192 start_codon:yes stop_codon:yes gene_type:complete
MKHNKMDFLSNAEFFDMVDAYEFSGYEDDDYYEDLLEDKLGSKWRKRPRRSKSRKEDFTENFL